LNFRKISKFSLNSRKSLKTNEEFFSPKNAHQKISILKDLEKGYGLLFEEFRHEKWTQRNFVFLDLIRQILFIFIVVFFYPSPFLQIILINAVQLIYMVATCVIKPFDQKFSKINFAITEIFMSLALISCLVIGIYDDIQMFDLEKRIQWGWVVPYCNCGLLYWVFITMLFKFVNKLIDLCRSHSIIHHIDH